MSDLLPLFPLPNVVLFPNVFLPLHIFEARYREMVADALSGDRVIGMALLKPGWNHDDEGQPPVFAMGCSGVITHVDRLSDGRYNLVLRGVERFRIVQEDHSRRYRRATVDWRPERALNGSERTLVSQQRTRLEELIAPFVEGSRADPIGTNAMSDEELVNALSQFLDLEPIEKQALLEQDGLPERVGSLIELLEMKVLMARTPGLSTLAH